MLSPLARLADFAIELPVCCSDTSLSKVVSLCARHQAEWMLLLDSHRLPLGVVRLVQVLSRLEDVSAAGATIGQQADLLYVVDWVDANQPLETLWPKLLAAPHRIYGYIDKPDTYYLLDREQLLAWALQTSQPSDRPDWQLVADSVTLPASIQNRSQAIAANAAWQQTFGEKMGLPAQAAPAWQFHRLPLRVLLETAAADPASSELWLVVASPDGPDAAVLNGWLTGVSHELKSPLTSLLGLTTLLLDQRLGQLNDKQHHYVDLMHQTVRRLNTTINHLLDWVRLDSGQLTLNPMMVDLRSLWPEILQQIYDQGSGITTEQLQAMSWTVAPNIQTVKADPLRLRQILTHLISYCLARSDGQAVCAGRVEDWGRWVGITISDAVFLSASQQSRLFQPQGFSSGLARLELGPALAWHLARLHGGDITFLSSAEAGSHFTVLLPRAEAAADQVLILLVADDAEIAHQVRQAFSPGNCRVAIAHSLSEAIDKATRLQPIALLVATETPLGQLEPLTYLRQRLGAYPPVIALATQSVSAADDAVALEDLGYPLPPALENALTLDHPRSLTVLHLCSNLPEIVGAANRDIGSWLRRYHCRVLEVDDPLQADLLSRVWQPDALVLDADFPDAHDCIAQISELPHLRRCPLVVLTTAAAAAAAEFPQLNWRSYLQPASATSALGLMQVLHGAIAKAD